MSGSVSQGIVPPLLRLPPELHTRILGHVISSAGTTDPIFPVLYTCKQLYRVALPLSVYKFQKRGPVCQDDFARRAYTVNFLRYITIIKPELAHQVKVAIIENWPAAAIQEPLGRLGPTKDDIKVYRALIHKKIGPDAGQGYEETREKLIRDLEQGFSDALYALLIIACSGLKEFYFATPMDSTYLPFLLSAAAMPVGDMKTCDSRPLSQLREIYHEEPSDRSGFVTFGGESAPLFQIQLPNLRSYECVHARVNVECKFQQLGPGSSTVEHLCFRSSRIASTIIQHIVGACKVLRSFEYTRGLPLSVFQEMLPLELMNALLPHANTLESLYLNVDEYDIINKIGWEDNLESLFLGPQLKEMVALKTLVTGMQPLTGMLDGEDISRGPNAPRSMYYVIEGAPRLAECLPENLERLEIFCCGRPILDQAQELLDLVSSGERFIRLRHLRFLFNMETMDWHEVKLDCSLPSVCVEVVFQTRKSRDFDLALGCPQNEDSVSTICSAVQAQHLGYRDQWFKYRGTDQAWVSDTGRIIVAEDRTLSVPVNNP